MMMQLNTLAVAQLHPARPPPGITLFPNLKPPRKTQSFHQYLVLLLTFIAYAAFHATRKPPSIVKSVLGSEIQSLSSGRNAILSSDTANGTTGWAPFDGPDGTHRLGELDLAFLLAYSAGMFVPGHIGDSVDLRIFLTVGMVGSGAFVVIFGFGYFFDVHLLGFYMIVQILCGVFQSVGWPCVVAVVGNWFGKDKRGLIMGVWASHTSVGNIIGSLVGSSVLGMGWGWSFVFPGIFIMIVAILVYLFLVVSPGHIGLELIGNEEIEMHVEGVALVKSEKLEVDEEETETEGLVAIGFLDAWRLPGVAPFAFCLFFLKLVAYTFLYWLPFYIRHTAIAGVHLSHKTAGILSTIFDVGGVLGGILAGFLSDTIGACADFIFIFSSLNSCPFGLPHLWKCISVLKYHADVHFWFTNQWALHTN